MSIDLWAEPIHGLILDIDDTLVDTRAAMHRAGAVGAAAALSAADTGAGVAQAVAPTAEHHAVSRMFYDDIGGFFDTYTRGELSFGQMRRLRWQDALTRLGIDASAEVYSTFETAYLAAFAASQTLFEDVAALLQRAGDADVGVCLLTNSGDEQTGVKLAAVGLAGALPVVTTDTLGVGKPDPAVFALAAERTGADPRHILSVGDTLHTDIAGARTAGMRAAWLQRPGRPEPRNAGWGTPLDDSGVVVVPDLHAVAARL